MKDINMLSMPMEEMMGHYNMTHLSEHSEILGGMLAEEKGGKVIKTVEV
jgi:hypothetical protein